MLLRNDLKEMRSRLSISQAELGRRTGLSRTTVGRIERGEYMLSLRIAMKLAKRMGYARRRYILNIVCGAMIKIRNASAQQ